MRRKSYALILGLMKYTCILCVSFCATFLRAQTAKKLTPALPLHESSPFVRKQRLKSSTKIMRGDTLIQIDTIIVSYRKKDTTVALLKTKGRVPKIHTFFTGLDSVGLVSALVMKSLLDSPLVFKDSSGQGYQVVSYRFCYRKKDVYIEDESMEVKTRYDLSCMLMNQSPLPTKYRQTIQPDVQAEEQFWFEQIIVQNNRGEKFLAADLSLHTTE